MGLLNVIRNLRLRQGLPIREIERRTGLSRNTIKKYLKAGTIEPKFTTPERPSKLDPFAEKLSGWLRTEGGKSRKQRRKAKQLHADLVVLAACDTGGGGAAVDRTGLTGGGEALGGLTRAMIYAGSRALVVSHWSIESESAVRLMTGFFSARAPSMAQSLQVSQAALQADSRYAHPYFWAPFVLIGDGK